MVEYGIVNYIRYSIWDTALYISRSTLITPPVKTDDVGVWRCRKWVKSAFISFKFSWSAPTIVLNCTIFSVELLWEYKVSLSFVQFNDLHTVPWYYIVLVNYIDIFSKSFFDVIPLYSIHWSNGKYVNLNRIKALRFLLDFLLFQ